MQQRFILVLGALVAAAPALAQENAGKTPPVLRIAATEPGRSGLVSADPTVLRYANVYADANGATHVQHCALGGFALESYASLAAPQWLGVPPGDIESISFAVLPVGYVGAWHHAPGRQWVIVLSGRWSVETTDGAVLEQGPGEVQFDADDGARPQGSERHVGHLTRQVGSEPNMQLIVSLKDGAHPPRPAVPCKPASPQRKTA